MDHPVAEPVEFVFLWWPDSEYGVVLSRDDYRLVDRFHLARQTARTWDEFLEQFGEYTHWLDDFMQFDETKPRGEDLLADLEDSLWVLGNDEFPLTQCVEESFGHYGSLFPECDDAVTIRTEYGMPLRLYPKTACLAIKNHLAQAGHQMSDMIATFPMHIYSYQATCFTSHPPRTQRDRQS